MWSQHALLEETPDYRTTCKTLGQKSPKMCPHHTLCILWMDNEKHGKVTQVWKKTGMIYDGDWRCGKREGCGTLSQTDPQTKGYMRVYVGSWRNDKKEESTKHYLSSYGQ